MTAPFVLVLVSDPRLYRLEDALLARLAAALGSPPRLLAAGEAAEFPLSASPPPGLVEGLLEERPVDVFFLPASGRRKRLLTADMDSTIIDREVIDELAAEAGIGPVVAAITARSMRGEIDFATALRERVRHLRGLPEAALERVAERLAFNPGARALIATMRAHGAITALVSGGFTDFSQRIAKQAGFHHHFANVLGREGGVLSGEVAEPILDREAKARILGTLADRYGIPRAATLAIGDGANDLAMLAAAGLGIAYRAKPVVAEQADLRIRHATLRAALFIQGYRAEEIREA
jgi:phosphoserine phosphatase